jgi:glutamate carboxypeptidase
VLGVPTLDGLGAVGEGAHSPGENILIHALPERSALVAGLLATI